MKNGFIISLSEKHYRKRRGTEGTFVNKCGKSVFMKRFKKSFHNSMFSSGLTLTSLITLFQFLFDNEWITLRTLFLIVASTHTETKQYYTLYNTLDDTKLYLEKEVFTYALLQSFYALFHDLFEVILNGNRGNLF